MTKSKTQLTRLTLKTADGKDLFLLRNEGAFYYYDENEKKFKDTTEGIITAGVSKFPTEHLYEEARRKNVPDDFKMKIDEDCYYERLYIYCGSNAHMWGQKVGMHSYAPKSNGHHYNIKQEDAKYFYTNKKDEIRELPQQTCKDMAAIFEKYNNFFGMTESRNILGQHLDVQIALGIIGIGKTVTPESLAFCAPKGETKSRYWIGDMVSWISKGAKQFGSISSFNKNGASIALQNGVKKVIAFDRIVKEENIESEEWKTILPQSVQDNLNEAVKNITVYKAKIENRKNLEIPYGSGRFQDARCVPCPSAECGMVLASAYGEDFVCVYCNQRAVLMKTDGEIGVFILADKPKKNEFCVKEARCCNNCDMFHFGYGRNGKRSTGYCTFANLCVQSHNVCEKWIPFTAERYSATLKQHVANLGTGVEEDGSHRSLNVARKENELEDRIYRKADHEIQKKKAMEMKGAYAIAYSKFLQEVFKKADSLPTKE